MKKSRTAKAKKRGRPVKKKEGPGGPRITKGKSKGDYGTDPDLLLAIREKFGEIVWDLAATSLNAVVPGYFSIKDDAFKQDWADLSLRYDSGLLWLNPPFTHIDPWAAMCKREADRGAEILFLVPGSIGSCWFRDHVFRKADVYYLCGRLIFKGETTPYPKDCMIVHYHPPYTDDEGDAPFKEEIWEWRKDMPGAEEADAAPEVVSLPEALASSAPVEVAPDGRRTEKAVVGQDG